MGLQHTYVQCPYNSRRLKNAPTPPHIDDDASPPDSDLSDDDLSLPSDNLSDESESTSNDDWCYEDDIISSDMCVCGALGRAHKRDCPMSSRSSFPTEECIVQIVVLANLILYGKQLPNLSQT